MLSDFLSEYKKEIIQLCRDKVLAAAEAKPTSELLDIGLPIFYGELIEVLRRVTNAAAPAKNFGALITEGPASEHGKESLRLGYTISQVVHSYGAVCQAITEFVQIKAYTITSNEFHNLNLCLDCAIAEAVTEFSEVHSHNVNQGEVERLGFLIHEMGNALTAASLAYKMIQAGHVGSAGNTSNIVNEAHERMRQLVDRALAEARMRGEAVMKRTKRRLVDTVRDVEATALIKNNLKDVHLEIDVAPEIYLTADHHLLFSALSNIVDNAIKFTKKKGTVTVRGIEKEGRILIEVEDECGGLPEGSTEDLFKIFVQKGIDKSGMGLGLSLSRKAIELHGGTVTVRNLAGKGCIFMLNLPSDHK